MACSPTPPLDSSLEQAITCIIHARMGKRVFAGELRHGYPDIDLTLELDDRGAFSFSERQFSYDFSFELTASGCWKATSEGDIELRIEESTMSWKVGSTVIAKPSGADLVVDNATLTRVDAST